MRGAGDPKHDENTDSRAAAPSALESAKTYTGRGAEANAGHSEARAARLGRVAEKQHRLTERAEKSGRVIPPLSEPDHSGARRRWLGVDRSFCSTGPNA